MLAKGMVLPLLQSCHLLLSSWLPYKSSMPPARPHSGGRVGPCSALAPLLPAWIQLLLGLPPRLTSPTQIASTACLYRPLFQHPSSLLSQTSPSPKPKPKPEPVLRPTETARTEVIATTTTRWVTKETNDAPCLVPDIGQPLAGLQHSNLPLPGRATPVRPSTSNLTLLTHMSVQGRTPPAHAVT